MKVKSKISFKTVFFTSMLFFVLASNSIVLAQNSDIVSKIKTGTQTFTDTTKVVVNAAIIIALAIGLITVVWMVNQNKPNGKEYLVGWLVAAIFSSVGLWIINF